MERLSFGARAWLAFMLPWKLLFDGVFAGRVHKLQQTGALPEAALKPALTEALPAPTEPKVVEAVEPEKDNTAALQVLSLLQREGRFVDFLQEDISGASDADIGAAARVVYEGCKRGLAEYVEIAPVRTEEEGDTVQLAPGYDARAIRVTGNVQGEPPFSGTLAHHGWRVTSVRLPKLSADHDPEIIAAAEVEL